MLHIDTIEREMVLPAAPETVWEKSFATTEALANWFPDRVEGTVAAGNAIFFVWGEHRCEALVSEYAPGRALSYKWHPGSAATLDAYPEGELTTVRFTLEPHAEGTLVRMVESGFSNIPEDRREFALGENTSGWDSELAKLPKGYAA
jgi:uncharacterized protein YndB with AHSA1/START domain